MDRKVSFDALGSQYEADRQAELQAAYNQAVGQISYELRRFGEDESLRDDVTAAAIQELASFIALFFTRARTNEGLTALENRESVVALLTSNSNGLRGLGSSSTSGQRITSEQAQQLEQLAQLGEALGGHNGSEALAYFTALFNSMAGATAEQKQGMALAIANIADGTIAVEDNGSLTMEAKLQDLESQLRKFSALIKALPDFDAVRHAKILNVLQGIRAGRIEVDTITGELKRSTSDQNLITDLQQQVTDNAQDAARLEKENRDLKQRLAVVEQELQQARQDIENAKRATDEARRQMVRAQDAETRAKEAEGKAQRAVMDAKHDVKALSTELKGFRDAHELFVESAKYDGTDGSVRILHAHPLQQHELVRVLVGEIAAADHAQANGLQVNNQ